jgi:hypothetical protein
VKDDEVIAHYGRAGEASPGVIRIDQVVVVAPPRPCILRTLNDLGLGGCSLRLELRPRLVLRM